MQSSSVFVYNKFMSELFSTLPRSLRIGVLRGGPSHEYENSLLSGDNMLKVLSETHRPIDIFISEDGKWHIGGIERSPERILKNVDVVWNGLHGTYGEDGGIQEILNHHGIKYTGSDRYASSIAMNRWLTKEHAKILGIKTPVGVLVRSDDQLFSKAKEIFESIPGPLAVKPAKWGYALGFYKADSFSELLNALEKILEKYDSAIVEEYISGKHATCGIMDGFRGQKNYVLPISEFSSISNDFVYPTSFTDKQLREIEESARKMHAGLGLKHYSMLDFVVSPRRGVYLLEITTSPKISESSAWVNSLKAVGASLKDFAHHTISLALNRK